MIKRRFGQALWDRCPWAQLTSLAISSPFFCLFLPPFFSPWGYGEYFQDVKPVQALGKAHTPGHVPLKPNGGSAAMCDHGTKALQERRGQFGTGPLLTFMSASSAPCSPHKGLQGQAPELTRSCM